MEFLLTAALAGLLATPHCAAMCGGFASACARPHSGLLAWHAGRLLTYTLLGGLAGGFGRLLPGPPWLPALISGALLLWFAASLAGIAPPSARTPGLARIGAAVARRPSWRWRVAFGAVTGLLPCGMVYAALSISIATMSPVVGAAAMLAFGAMTLPGLTILTYGVRRLALRGFWTRRVLAAFVLATGLWSITMRGFARNHTAAADHTTDSAPQVTPVPHSR